MIDNFTPLLNAAVVIVFIGAGIRALWGKGGMKDFIATLTFGAFLAAFANKPILLSQLGTVLINLLQSIGGDINV